MKKKYKKGFFLSETMVVLAVVAIILIAVFKIFSTTYIKYQESENYNTINSVNALASVKKYFESFGEIDTESLLGDNAYIDLTTYANYSNEYYNSIKEEYDIDSIYLINMSTINSNLSNFNVLLRKYIESLPNSNNIMLLINVKGNQFTSTSIAYGLPSLIGNEEDEYGIYIDIGEEFVDPGYTNWEGESPITTWESPLDINTEEIYYLKYNFDNYILRRKVQVIEKEYEFNYTGSFQEFTVPTTGWYEVELWGAQGADGAVSFGGYTSGKILMNKGEKYYIYVGEGLHTPVNQMAFNGGTANSGGNNGGGATDIRWFGNNNPSNSDLMWNSSLGIRSRIMVAGGSGSGSGNNTALLGRGGGLIAQAGGGTAGGTQTAFGAAQSSSYTASNFGIANGGCSGGNGYYPGGGATCANGAGGGSSFISGYAGVNAIDSSGTHTNNTLHYSGKYFIDGKMASGINSGHGKAKITFISGSKLERINTKLNNVRYIKDCTTGNSSNNSKHWIEMQAIYKGNNIANKYVNPNVNVTSNVPISSWGTQNLNTVLDGVIYPTDATTTVSVTGENGCIIIDLGLETNNKLYNLDEVAIWHYWNDVRIYYDNITYVSSDSENWTPIIATEEPETSQGKRVNAYEKQFYYTGNVQEFIVPVTGTYQIELWGAQGGNANYTTQYYGGKGAYTIGKILLTKNEKLYVYVGGQGVSHSGTDTDVITLNGNGYNGGGDGRFSSGNSNGGGGGGATDIRITNNALKDRIMVASGGGGARSHKTADAYAGNGGVGGGLIGADAEKVNLTCYRYGTGGTQIEGGNSVQCDSSSIYVTTTSGSFGLGGNNNHGGGGGGYYGGGAGRHTSAGGGSSFISGYTGCVAVTSAGTPKTGCETNNSNNSCSIHFSNKIFTDSAMIAGNEEMPTHDGTSTMIGNSGNGYAKITLIR